MSEATPQEHEALAKALYETGALPGTEVANPLTWDDIGDGLRSIFRHRADALLASGVVVGMVDQGRQA